MATNTNPAAGPTAGMGQLIPGTNIMNPNPYASGGGGGGPTPVGMGGGSVAGGGFGGGTPSPVPPIAPGPSTTAQLLSNAQKTLQDILKQLAHAPPPTGTPLKPGDTIPGTTIATPTPGATPAPPTSPYGNPKDLVSNAAIDLLGTQIQKQLSDLSAGIPVGGSEKIISDLMDKFGVKGEMDVLKSYNQTILSENKAISDLPDAVKNTLAGIGINNDQLTRLVAKESLPHEKALKTAMEGANATQDQINNSMKFVSMFADAESKDRAAQLEVTKFQIQQNLGLYKDMQANQKEILTLAVNEQKQLMTDKNNALKFPLPADVQTAIQSATDSATVARLTAPYEAQQKAITMAKDIAPSLAAQIASMSPSQSHAFITANTPAGVDANTMIGFVEAEEMKKNAGGFTNTQENKGANASGLPLPNFDALTPEVKNYYVSSSATELKAMNDLFKDVTTGVKTADQVKQTIDEAGGITDAVREHLKQHVDSLKAPEQSGLSKVMGFLGGLFQ